MEVKTCKYKKNEFILFQLQTKNIGLLIFLSMYPHGPHHTENHHKKKNGVIFHNREGLQEVTLRPNVYLY